MNKTIIVSNRLPLNITLTNGEAEAEASVGGLATGMRSVHAEGNGIWIGWTGIAEGMVTPEQQGKIDTVLAREKCVGVGLTEKEIEDFYYGFSNNALWPLFHYFAEYTEFELAQWNAYREVNRKFADVVIAHANEGDTIWIHDYQLLLLPQMIREMMPGITIGFFLHIPYPSFEIFRLFPWRNELLEGMLGANLIGFHTYDYVRHFLSSVARIKGLETKFNTIHYKGRTVKVDSFPMGIDYNRFHSAAMAHKNQAESQKTELLRKLDEHSSMYHGKLVLSIDRMDYTKGIPNRLRAFEYFLDHYPEYHEKVRLVMLAVPSRTDVPQYQVLKRDTDELVGRINGRFATVNWTPVWYFYRAMPFDDLIDLYSSAHIALITPLRDGMNLVAKEYVASRTEPDGVLILSEMAGAAKELHEALLINPHNFEQFADTLKQAIEMPQEEQRTRMASLQKRVERYNVEKWSSEFLKALEAGKQDHEAASTTKRMTPELTTDIADAFCRANKRLLLLDYDGTLTGFKNIPSEASPDDALNTLLDELAGLENTDVALISGRDRKTLEGWFGQKDYSLVTDHGIWLRRKGSEWEMLEHMKSEWKSSIRPVLETFADSTPGAFVEEKDYSLAWHYRQADRDLAAIRMMELKPVLNSLIANNPLTVLEGNKVLEVKSSNINKGRAASKLVHDAGYDFIFAIGDDWTDEYMFEELPEDSFTIKVGTQKTHARFFVEEISEVRPLLEKFLPKVKQF